MELISKNERGFELRLTVPDTLINQEKMSLDTAQDLLKVAYQPFIDKLNDFITYAIGCQDFESIQSLEHAISNMAKSKIDNM